MHANVVKRVKFGLEIARNSFKWTILRDNPFAINWLEQMIEDQTAEEKALNPKKRGGGTER